MKKHTYKTEDNQLADTITVHYINTTYDGTDKKESDVVEVSDIDDHIELIKSAGGRHISLEY